MNLLSKLILASFLFLSGCDTLNWQQYKISNVQIDSPDSERLKSAMKIVADQVGLEEQTTNSRIAGTLVFYTEPEVQYFHTDIGARFSEGSVLIDLMAGFGPAPPKYKQAKHLLGSILSKEFDSRLSIPESFVPVNVKDTGGIEF